RVCGRGGDGCGGRGGGGGGEGVALWAPGGPGLLAELVVAQVVQRLDHAGSGQPERNLLAAADVLAVELRNEAVYLGPVVHHVDDDLAGQESGVKLTKPVEGDGQDHQVRVSH